MTLVGGGPAQPRKNVFDQSRKLGQAGKPVERGAAPEPMRHDRQVIRSGGDGARRGELARAQSEGGSTEGGADAARIEDVVRWGTAGGAAVLGLDGIGTLVPGQAADLAVYRLDDPRYFGLHDVAIAPVSSGGRPTLRALLVGGRVIAQDDAIPGVDLAELGAQARAAVGQLQQRAERMAA